ncbi:MAG: class I SAM-dependent methyltransferase [Oscillospiraceae bacterium]|nr:class I SAM-dependent methyltransferase [Oscillospiraceae bacterium]
MNAYGALAAFYDQLTEDVDYRALADHYEASITQGGRRPEIVLDLACGTGRLTRLLAARGYQMIGVDISSDMLAEAAEQAGTQDILYLEQALTELDLYGTVDAALCSLDGLNYLPPDELHEAFRRVFLFLAPGGVFAFDLNTTEKLQRLDGEIFCDEREDLLCLWRCSFDEAEHACYYDFDFFKQEGAHWSRSSESHTQYAYTEAEVRAQLEAVGFREIAFTGETDRIFVTALRP